jgi:hypothetical protein
MMRLSYKQIIGVICEEFVIAYQYFILFIIYLLFYNLKHCIVVCHFTLTKYVDVGRVAQLL